MKYVVSILFLFTVLISAQRINACEIKFTIEGEKQEGFIAGDEIVVSIDVVLTHRVCTEGIENTKFNYDGIKVLGATKWAEYENGKFKRKLKIKVLDGEFKELFLEAIRKCDKEGGYAKIIFAQS